MGWAPKADGVMEEGLGFGSGTSWYLEWLIAEVLKADSFSGP